MKSRETGQSDWTMFGVSRSAAWIENSINQETIHAWIFSITGDSSYSFGYAL